MTGGHDTRVSLAALIAVRPGQRPRLIWRTHRARRGDKRKGFTETDYARFLDAAHQQLHGPVVLVWDGLNTHTSRAAITQLGKPSAASSTIRARITRRCSAGHHNMRAGRHGGLLTKITGVRGRIPDA